MSKVKARIARAPKAEKARSSIRESILKKIYSKKIARKSVVAKDKAKFVLVYHGIDDPSLTKVKQVKRRLAPAKVEEVLPGTLRVSGNEMDIKVSAKGLSSWTLAPEGKLSDRPPSHSKFRAA